MTGKPSTSPNGIKPRRLLFQTAQEEIKAYIIRNALKPGDPLPPETELAHRLSISRNSVREAVKALEAVGIIEARVGAGLFVRAFSFDALFDNLAYGLQFDTKHLSDILEVRHLIERGLTDRVLQALAPGQVARLRALVDAMRAEAGRGRYVPDLDQEFHHVMYENVGNSVVISILDVFWQIYRGAQERAEVPEPVDPLVTYQKHEEIVAALEAGDRQALHAAMATHWGGIQGRLARAGAAEEASTSESESPT